MEDTLQIGDRIAVNKFGALFSEAKRGEVVVLAIQIIGLVKHQIQIIQLS